MILIILSLFESFNFATKIFLLVALTWITVLIGLILKHALSNFNSVINNFVHFFTSDFFRLLQQFVTLIF